MKLLLVSDIPPCTNYTGGLVLDQLCRFLPRGSIACSILRNPDLTDAVVTPDLDWIPVDYISKPPEHGQIFHGRGRRLNSLGSLVREIYHERVTCPRLVERIVAFGRDFGAEAVWCVLQGQTEIRVARPVAARLGAPLLTMTWDPLYFWLEEHKVNRLAQWRITRQYAEVLAASDGFAAASWAMAEEYGPAYRVRTVPLVPGLDARFALLPAAPRNNGELVIAAAGKIYPVETWQALVAALESARWTVAGRKVRIQVLTRQCEVPWMGKVPLELLGWHSQQDAVRLLAEADVLLCPYWLNEARHEVTQMSFPGKLITYLATGRPVMFLGPADASPARFLKEQEAGLMCHSAEPDEILGQLRRLFEQPGLYAQLARNGRRAFDQHLTLDAVRRRFAEFLRVPEQYLVGGTAAAARAA
jgi:glycosyltransferase involved in cell wall biosynthesis